MSTVNALGDNQVYGRYSLGSGSILPDPNKLFSPIDEPEIIGAYKEQVNWDLIRAGISLEELTKYTVLDVGTGRQAIAFYLLGAEKVKHYDISPDNVNAMTSFIEREIARGKITTECLDLVISPPPCNTFDFVYLQGIVQHFSHVGTGLKNCMQALKKNGYLWLYFYRSGTFHQFAIYLLRDLINSRDVDHREYFVNSTLLYSEDYRPNAFVSGVMDSLFVTYSHLYTPDTYIRFLKECGYKVTFSSKLDPYGSDVCHEYGHQSVILTCKKEVEKDLDTCDIEELLSPENSINQLDREMYSPHQHAEILQTIDAYESLKSALSSKNIPSSIIMSVAFRVLDLLEKVDISESRNAHIQLQAILNNTGKLVESEWFGTRA